MTPPRCRDIFEQAVGLAPSDRKAFVDAACGGNDLLRQEIESLLAAHGDVGRFLDALAGTSASEPDPLHVGEYQVLRKLGEGGMGRVYLAEPGPVALKLVRRDLDPAVVLRRFERERGILSRLNHPNVARLLDGGQTDDGAPYLVLTYVEGLPLDAYCQRARLTLRPRLELFQRVCDAVSYAHRHLVIHRDLKPANILVRETGAPVVLDFGLAKLTQTDLQHALDSTSTGHRLLTPEYASPEQLTGLPITPATDVYALGLILYEMLTGVRPHRFETWSMAEIVTVVCETMTPPPSVVASLPPHPLHDPDDDGRPAPSFHPDDLRGPLDAIVMKAIAKEPERRYSHVVELESDVERYLAHASNT